MKIINNIALSFILLNNPAVCQNKQDKIDICDKKVALANLDAVQKNAKEIITTSNDNCVLGLLDTLTALFIKTEQIKYIETLDAICKVSDGYVSEYFWELTEKLVHQSFGAYTGFLSTQKERCMEKFLLQTITTGQRKKDVKNFIDKELKVSTIKAEKKKYLSELLKKITE